MLDSSTGEILNERYQVVRVLGEGAMGRTLLANDLQRPRGQVDGEETFGKVAIKELLPSRMKRWKDYDLFHRECATLESLNHPGIPSYIEDFKIDSDDPDHPPRLFLVQEFVIGKTLDEVAQEHEGTLDEEEVKDILRQTLTILVYLHELNPPVIHRDIKPSNLMQNPDGRIYLIDFGAVRESVTLEGKGSTVIGTFGYMPPEQYAGGSYPATDLFALGATCVELLSGRAPGELFVGMHEFQIPDDLPISLGFERLLLKLTEPDVSSRYQSAQEVLQALDSSFLMTPQMQVAGSLPIPHEIISAPRGWPGFHLRDAYTGRSHLLLVMLSALAAILATILPVATLRLGYLAFIVSAMFTATIWFMAWSVSTKSRNEISVFRRGTYTLGEVTGRFLSYSAHGSHLTYRYKVGDDFTYGCLSTSDSAYKDLCVGDPLGLIYLPDEPTEHVMYAVGPRWASEQALDTRMRQIESNAA